jgi:hypothetical protein
VALFVRPCCAGNRFLCMERSWLRAVEDLYDLKKHSAISQDDIRHLPETFAASGDRRDRVIR